MSKPAILSIKSRRAKLIAALGLITFTATTWANGAAAIEPSFTPKLQGVFGLGLTFGGDTLAHFTMTDGSTRSLTAGGLFHFYGGGRYQFHPHGAIQATLGYQASDVTASNGSASFSRFPFEVIGQYRANEKIQLGGGLRLATGASFSTSGAASSMTGPNTSLTANLGTVLEGDYFYSEKGSFALRFVSESFKGPYGQTIDGSHIGLYVKGLF
jgi:hypothetical protein